MTDDGEKVTYFGETDARGRHVRFGIKAKDRTKHMYVIGKTGMGKSTLLENMAIQDIQNGEGLAFVDPHGASAEKLLDYVPEERVKDVLYFAPFDLGYPVSFNILEDMGPDKRHLVVNGLMSTFEKLWADMWSARMSYILQNTIQALLEYPDSTLLGINRVLVDKNYRKKVVDNVTDPAVKAFWIEEFAKYTDRYTQEATPAIQNKVGQFVSNPLIRNIIGQPNSAFNIREMMDNKKILIVNLSKGKVGEGNANLLGGMLITRIYLAAMSRADASERELAKLPNFYLYVDEFQSFANKTFENILSEARKYKLNLTIAHQYIEQMEEEVRDAVFGNVGTMITFRVGAYDAEVLEKEFAPTFYADNLVNLGVYQMYLKLMIDGVSSAPFSATSMPPIPPPPLSFKEQVVAYTRDYFGRPRAIVEEEIKKWHEAVMPEETLPRDRSGVSDPSASRDRRQDMPQRTSPQDERGKGRDFKRENETRGSENRGSDRGGVGVPQFSRREGRRTTPVSLSQSEHRDFRKARAEERRVRPMQSPRRSDEIHAPVAPSRQAPVASSQGYTKDTPNKTHKGEIPTGADRSPDPVSLKEMRERTQPFHVERREEYKKGHNRQHVGTHRNELRAALSAALAVAPPVPTTTPTPIQNTASTSPISTRTPTSQGPVSATTSASPVPPASLKAENNKERQTSPDKQEPVPKQKNEIPEAELRKILDED